MYSQFLTIMTSLAMLWHSIGGCCWHHEHQDCDRAHTLCASGDHSHSSEIPSGLHYVHSHHSDGDEPSAPAPCGPSDHCTGETCVYVKSVTIDVTCLIHSPAELASPVTELLTAQAATGHQTTDRVGPCRDGLSAQQRCALTQSWLL